MMSARPLVLQFYSTVTIIPCCLIYPSFICLSINPYRGNTSLPLHYTLLPLSDIPLPLSVLPCPIELGVMTQ